MEEKETIMTGLGRRDEIDDHDDMEVANINKKIFRKLEKNEIREN